VRGGGCASPHFLSPEDSLNAQVFQGDALHLAGSLASDSIDAVITDPPYGLKFMGKDWDHGIPGQPFWEEFLRTMKPGAHLLAFGGTRTHHRLTVAIEDAGFEIRDCLMWLYGSGFPKSLDVSKAIDKAAGAEREVVGPSTRHGGGNDNLYDYGKGLQTMGNGVVPDITAPATELAQQWDGWGTALKPGWEPIIMARKPLGKNTVAANVLTYGTGAINIDGCRIGDEILPEQTAGQARIGTFERTDMVTPERVGRWPANVALDETAATMLDEQSGTSKSTKGKPRRPQAPGDGYGMTHTGAEYNDIGGASRFFYTAKASRKERGEGNNHPTVKPITLMRWLCRLVTPPGGTILDPFNGSGSTGCAAVLEGFRYLGFELDQDFVDISEQRIAHWSGVSEPFSYNADAPLKLA